MLLSQTLEKKNILPDADTSPRVHVEEPDWLRFKSLLSGVILVELNFFSNEYIMKCTSQK